MLTEQPIRGLCHICEKRLVAKQIASSKLGFTLFYTKCATCRRNIDISKNGGRAYQRAKAKYNSTNKYKKYRKSYCEKCGFIPIHIGQLDVDHIDGNHVNDDPSNLQTLCANCHRLKTILDKQNPKKR